VENCPECGNRRDATGEKKILPDTRFAEVVKFLRYWQGHAEYDALVTEQLHIVAKEAVQAWLSETRANDCNRCGGLQ